MRKFLLFSIIMSIFFNYNIAGQDLALPHWIIGSWHNTYESNTNKFEFWTFRNDSILIINGLHPGLDYNKYGYSLNKKYANYDILKESNDSIYKLKFLNSQDSAFYEFKLNRLNYSEKAALTISIITNGMVERVHSTSCNLVLTK